MWYFRRIVGNSMEPTLHDGQIVLVGLRRSFKVGDVVIAVHNTHEIIKRITKMSEGTVFLEGDNPDESTDSRQYGPIVDRHIQGVVVWPKVYKRRRSRKYK